MPGLLGWSSFLQTKRRANLAAALVAYGCKAPSTLSLAQS